MVQLARDYATRRTAFGKLLKDHPLHMQTLARMEVNCRWVNKQTLFSVSHHALLMFASDTDRWRLVELSSSWWMCVVCWAERKAAWQRSLIRTSYVCSHLWSNSTLASRCTSTVRDSKLLSDCLSSDGNLVLLPLRRWLWCRRVWRVSEGRVTSRTPGCLDYFVIHRWSQSCRTKAESSNYNYRSSEIEGFRLC